MCKIGCGRNFDSLRNDLCSVPVHTSTKHKSSPSLVNIRGAPTGQILGILAQSVEQSNGTREARGSDPRNVTFIALPHDWNHRLLTVANVCLSFFAEVTYILRKVDFSHPILATIYANFRSLPPPPWENPGCVTGQYAHCSLRRPWKMFHTIYQVIHLFRNFASICRCFLSKMSQCLASPSDVDKIDFTCWPVVLGSLIFKSVSNLDYPPVYLCCFSVQSAPWHGLRLIHTCPAVRARMGIRARIPDSWSARQKLSIPARPETFPPIQRAATAASEDGVSGWQPL